MKKRNILIVGLSVLSLMAVAGGVVYASPASNRFFFKKGWNTAHRWENMTEEEKSAFQTKMQEKRTEQLVRREAVDKAMEANDYNAWVEAVGKDSPMAQKITNENFSKLVEVHNLRKQEREKLQELGLWGFGHLGKGRIFVQ
ncbi:MAG: hypothetical protein V1770_06530 [bacterium]